MVKNIEILLYITPIFNQSIKFVDKDFNNSNNLIEMNSPSETNHSSFKSPKQTMRMTASPMPIRQQSSIISLNFEDLQNLMQKKQKEYQNQLLIQDAKRVHKFLMDVQQQQRVKRQQSQRKSKRRLKQALNKFNHQTIAQTQQQWKNSLEQTLKQLQNVSQLADETHQKQFREAQKRIQDLKNGKGIQNLKYSKKVIEMQDQLRKLVKSQLYQQAQIINKRLQTLKKKELKQYLLTSLDKQKKSIIRLKQQQQKQKQILSYKLATIYQGQQRKRNHQMQKMVKNLRTYQIDSTKLKSKVNRMVKTCEQRPRSYSVSVSSFSAVKNYAENKEIGTEAKEENTATPNTEGK